MKDVQFGHWIPAHALSFAGFRFGPGVGKRGRCRVSLYLFIFISILKVCKLLTLCFNRLS